MEIKPPEHHFQHLEEENILSSTECPTRLKQGIEWVSDLPETFSGAMDIPDSTVCGAMDIPDGTAVVDCPLQVAIPTDLIASNEEIIKIPEAGKEVLPPQVNWDSGGIC